MTKIESNAIANLEQIMVLVYFQLKKKKLEGEYWIV